MKIDLKKLHILADFDGTLTKTWFKGKKVPSLISILRDNDFLNPSYRKKSHELYDHYHAYESDFALSKLHKKKLMLEWWKKHFELLIKSGLNKKDLEKTAKNPYIQLRRGAKKFFDFLKKYNIPLVIMSSSGIGETILIFLKNKKLLSKNIFIITNSFIWDKNGRAIGIKKPIIHSLNKDETSLRKLPVFKKINKHTDVILLGNNPEDILMVKGFQYETLLKIGFFNSKSEKNLHAFENNFDIIIKDESMEKVNKILRDIKRS